MTTLAPEEAVTNSSTVIRWHPEQRVAAVSYSVGARLASEDGVFLVQALTGWIGVQAEPFALLVDAFGLRSTDAEYRARASGFFRQHRDTAFIALTNLGPVIHVVVELFRIGTGIQLKTFADDAAGRLWLRTKGITA